MAWAYGIKDVNSREFNFSIREQKFPGSRRELEPYWYHEVTATTTKLVASCDLLDWTDVAGMASMWRAMTAVAG